MKLVDRIVYRLEYLSRSGYPLVVFLLVVTTALALSGAGVLLLSLLE